MVLHGLIQNNLQDISGLKKCKLQASVHRMQLYKLQKGQFIHTHVLVGEQRGTEPAASVAGHWKTEAGATENVLCTA